MGHFPVSTLNNYVSSSVLDFSLLFISSSFLLPPSSSGCGIELASALGFSDVLGNELLGGFSP